VNLKPKFDPLLLRTGRTARHLAKRLPAPSGEQLILATRAYRESPSRETAERLANCISRVFAFSALASTEFGVPV
jgi:hypothetical protein